MAYMQIDLITRLMPASPMPSLRFVKLPQTT